MGGPVGMLVGAAIGASGSAALASLAFRNRESTEQTDHFLDAQTLNNGNASVRPIRPHSVTNIDQREQNPEALRQRQDIPTYYRMDGDDNDAPAPAITEPGRQQEPLRPTAARTPMVPRLTPQGVIDSIAASQPLPPEVLRLQRKAARNRLAPGQSAGPPGSIQDVMQATAAPTGGSSASSSLPFGINASAPPLPVPQRNRRNKTRPVAAS